MRISLKSLTLTPVVVAALSSYGLAHDKSHKEAWSDAFAEAGPMVASLERPQGARTVVQEESPVGVAAGSAGAVGGAAAAETERQNEKLTDEKILHVAHVANTGEIDQAKLAAARAQDPRVREYAKMMIRMHSDADKKEADVVRRRSLTMIASKTSDNLVKDGKSTMEMLKSKTGPEFDHAYIDAQVKNHTMVLNLIDTRLEPSANDKEVKNLVSGLRPTVAAHLDQAKSIQSKLKE